MLHNEDLSTSFAELENVCILFMTLPVSVATAERSFSKLKIIKKLSQVDNCPGMTGLTGNALN